MEELLTGEKHLLPNLHHQEALIKKYCGGIEDRIRLAADKENAKQLVDNVCKGLEQECNSSVVRSFLQQYVHDIFQSFWKLQK